MWCWTSHYFLPSPMVVRNCVYMMLMIGSPSRPWPLEGNTPHSFFNKHHNISCWQGKGVDKYFFPTIYKGQEPLKTAICGRLTNDGMCKGYDGRPRLYFIVFHLSCKDIRGLMAAAGSHWLLTGFQYQTHFSFWFISSFWPVEIFLFCCFANFPPLQGSWVVSLESWFCQV